MTRAGDVRLLERLTPFPQAPTSRDPLGFPGYRAKLDEASSRTNESESVVCGIAACGHFEVVAIVFDFRFMGGSLGEATGRRIVEAIRQAISRRLTLVTIAASGGARMQEGMLSLIQMPAIAAALNRLRAAGLPHLAVARQPTTGGVWASLVSTADVILAETEAAVSFTGSRVRGAETDTIEFTSEGKLAAGAIDSVVPRAELPAVLRHYVRALASAIASPPDPCPVPDALPGGRPGAKGWSAVKAARDPERPRASAYLDAYFDDLAPISGDRVSGADATMLCGIGLRGARAIAYVAQTGGANTPAGFRTARRLVELAEALRIPLLTLIDTFGADASAAAEQAGVGTAIAEMLLSVTRATVPITSLLIGQGSSGGAIALAAPGRTWAVPGSYFSVLSPEGAAAILYRDPGRASEAADLLRVDCETLVNLGIARAIVEPAIVAEIRHVDQTRALPF
ncbi:MAG TPA: carboxyl transferase domain-containing protein [Solirubrobacteraceae bacterium]|jgi:acetyl-CoA carboxylase carboxyl transferase subunit beta|nr:carboxyl transferase domain-containing protein [Solirubrobacteraceae bacterium]